jgi:hypothetical protein
MAVRKCPMCGGDVVGDVCFSCGFELPDEEAMTSAHIPEPETVYAEVVTDEKSRYTPPPRVKTVNEGESPSYYGQSSDYSSSEGSFERFCEDYNRMTFSDKIAKYWWAMLILLILPGALPIIAAIAGMLISKSPAVHKFAGSLLLFGIASLFIFG